IRWPENSVASLDFSADGKRWAIGYRNGAVEIADAETLRLERMLSSGVADGMVRLSPDGSFLVTHHPEVGILAAFDLKSGRRLWHHHQAPAWRSTALAFAPGGIHLATGDSDRHIRILELATGKIIKTLEFPAGSKAKELDQTAIAPGVPMLPAHARMRLESTHFAHPGSLQAVFFLKDADNLLLLGDHEEAPAIFDAASGKVVKRLETLQKAKPYRHHELLTPDRRHLL